MFYFLYNMMVHGNLSGGDGLTSGTQSLQQLQATVLFSLAASRQSVQLSEYVLGIIQCQSSLSLSYV